MTAPPLDVVYLFQHSRHGDEEIRYSLRSLAAHCPYVRKVWIFGDRPAFLAGDTTIVEHVPHGYIAPLLGYKTPVRNDLLMLFLASLIPGLAFDFVRFSDDYIILELLARDQLCQTRALEDLSQLASRGAGKFKALLWQTYDVLKHFGFSGINFETHVPQAFTRKLVFECFMTFREFLSEDRFAGLLAATTLYNYALKQQRLPLVWLAEEQSRAGIYGECPAADEIEERCRGRLFLSFDDAAFRPAMQTFLARRFPDKCKYEL